MKLWGLMWGKLCKLPDFSGILLFILAPGYMGPSLLIHGHIQGFRSSILILMPHIPRQHIMIIICCLNILIFPGLFLMQAYLFR